MENENNKNCPFGRKEAEGFAAPGGMHDANCVGCGPMPPGLLSMTPLGAGRSSPYMPSSSRRSVDQPREMRPPHTASPHRYAPDTERETVVITPRSKP
jgi:hypothetical protein